MFTPPAVTSCSQLDQLCANSTLTTYFGTHDEASRDRLQAEWARFRCWPFAGRRLGPDLGTLQQPLGEVSE